MALNGGGVGWVWTAEVTAEARRWLDRSAYQVGWAPWTQLQPRAARNLTHSRLLYLALWAALTCLLNAPSALGAVVWLLATFIVFGVKHVWLTSSKRWAIFCLGLMVLIYSSSCSSSSCLSWSQLLAAVVILGHAFVFDGTAGALLALTPAHPRSAVEQTSKPSPTAVAPPRKPLPALPTDAHAPSSPVPANTADRRFKIVQEIVATELTYLGQLCVIRELFMDKLAAVVHSSKSSGGISADDFRTIFSDIDVIYNYSSSLHSDLQKRLSTWNAQTSKLGDIFITIAHFLKTYQPYISNYAKSISILQSCCKSANFAQTLRELETDPRCKNASLQSFLITPIQRIPRYLLLLKELIKHTDSSHLDYQDLQRGLEQIQQVATALNEAERQAESAFKLYQYQMALGDGLGVDLLAPHRRFILASVMRGTTKSDLIDSELSDLYLVLCNDCLVVCKSSRRLSSRPTSPTKLNLSDEFPEKLVFKVLFKFRETALQSVQGNLFTLTSPEHKSIFEASNVTEKKEWLAKLQVAIKESREAALRSVW